jgi:uncharacterized C2H2 Zn-finger protein
MDYPDPVPLTIVLDSKTLPCPECGQLCKDSTGLGVHRSVKHGYTGNKKNRKKRRVAAAGERVLASGSIPRQPKVTKPDWSTREVFDSVVSLLWPGDSMPVAALPILLDWKDDTERMLHRLEALP